MSVFRLFASQAGVAIVQWTPATSSSANPLKFKYWVYHKSKITVQQTLLRASSELVSRKLLTL